MALITHNITLDITPGLIPPVVPVSEYDVGRDFVITLQNRGQAFTIPSGTTAKVEGTIAGHPFSENATVSGSSVTFELTKSMTAYSGRAWTKIKLTQNSKPVSTCGFWLDCDRAGVEADTILHSPGFQEQINEGIAEYFDNDPPFFELPSGGQSGQALVSDGQDGGIWGVKPFQLPSGGVVGQSLLSDGNNGAYWGTPQGGGGGGSGLTDVAKQALLNCFQHGAWVDDQGQTYYQALYNALYSSSQDVDRITATFAQGGATIMTTDSLNDLRQYLTVKAYYTGGASETVTAYTLTGTLTAGTSTITATYGGKSATFNVNVTAPSADVQRDGNTLFIINASVTRDGSTLVFS